MTDDFQDEAERLSQLPVEVQRQVVAIHRATAEDPQASDEDREFARRRVEALERHLGLGKNPYPQK